MLSRSLPLSLVLIGVLLFTSACQQSNAPSSDASSTQESTQQISERENVVPRVSPNAIAGQTIGITEVRMTYGRPHVRGRKIFGGLVPYDEVWRTGANEATTISFSTPVQIEGNALDAGTYGFFTIPGQDTWTLIFNETADQWGAYNYDSSKDALRVEVEPETAPKHEMMSFNFHNVTDSTATAALYWDETRVPFQISTNTTDLLRARAEENLSGTDDWQATRQYVGYAIENEVLLDEALTWVNQSIESKETFQKLHMKAHVLAGTDQLDQAVETANAALSKAEEMEESPDAVDNLETQIEDWKSEM